MVLDLLNIKCRNFVFVCIVVLLFEIWNKIICINSGNILLKYKLYESNEIIYSIIMMVFFYENKILFVVM